MKLLRTSGFDFKQIIDMWLNMLDVRIRALERNPQDADALNAANKILNDIRQFGEPKEDKRYQELLGRLEAVSSGKPTEVKTSLTYTFSQSGWDAVLGELQKILDPATLQKVTEVLQKNAQKQ